MPQESFKLPEIHSFPPFFTLQPTSSTQAKQLQLWSDLLLAFCRHNRIFHISTSSAASPKSQLAPLFINSSIKRSLNREAITAVIDDLVKKGSAEWLGTGKEKEECLVYFKTPTEWADLIHKWAFDTGSTNSVCTVYELLHSDGTEGWDFHEMDERILMKALNILAKNGKSQIFTASAGDVGVKFF
ncbi:Vacuolar protein-sorting-associated protein 25 [Gaertneriomyces sp. JEL0708]|nr:Vacuolar protein-sorting-associated protein 25 [Gaertneriomyces sp. JEL0708]